MSILSQSKPEAPTVSQNRLDFIEALRGLAALYVVAFHLAHLPNPHLEIPFWADKFIQAGGSGVTLFFIVSAFTLTLSMRLHEKEPHPTRRFYLRRVFRIVPLYYVWMILSWVRNTFFFRATPSLIMLLLGVSFTFNLVPGYQQGLVWASWTLGVEMLFYLLFPLVYRYINNIQKSFGFFFVTLTISSIYTSLLTHYLHVGAEQVQFVLQRSILHQLPIFAFGMVVFYIFEKFVQNKSLAPSWGFVLIAASLFGISAYFDGRLGFFLDGLYWQAINYGLLVLGLSILPVGLLVNRLTLFWGKLSYSLYLNHPTLVFALIPLYRIIYATQLPVTLKYGICFLIVLVLLTLISYITYRFIEKPGMALGTKLIKMFASNPIVHPVPVATPLAVVTEKIESNESGD
jgi:peptidoglycan/LPS O-acetylase OafA/YrhL